jgi:hypothetical protein
LQESTRSDSSTISTAAAHTDSTCKQHMQTATALGQSTNTMSTAAEDTGSNPTSSMSALQQHRPADSSQLPSATQRVQTTPTAVFSRLPVVR